MHGVNCVVVCVRVVSAPLQVLGDDGRLYVPAENVDIYREEVLPLATMITPNQFEAELLSGVTIVTEEDAVRACMALHSRCVEGGGYSSIHSILCWRCVSISVFLCCAPLCTVLLIWV